MIDGRPPCEPFYVFEVLEVRLPVESLSSKICFWAGSQEQSLIVPIYVDQFHERCYHRTECVWRSGAFPDHRWDSVLTVVGTAVDVGKIKTSQ